MNDMIRNSLSKTSEKSIFFASQVIIGYSIICFMIKDFPFVPIYSFILIFCLNKFSLLLHILYKDQIKLTLLTI